MTTLALIGVGEWGKNYLRTAATLDNVEIKYICAQSQQTLDLLPDTYIKTLSIKDLLKNKQIDGFIIATPASTHFAIAKQLLTEGCNLLIEKPLATTYEQALELQKIWQIKKPKVLMGHLYLYNPAYQEFKKLFKHLKTAKSIHFEGLSSPIRRDVSVIWDWVPHPISILIDLVKQPISKVSAIGSAKNPKSKLYDTVKAFIQFSSGLKASIQTSWLGSSQVRKLIAQGKNETIKLDDTNVTNQKILFHKLNTLPQHPRYNLESALTQQLREFVAAIQEGKKITSDIDMGVKVVKVLSAIEQSVKNNGESIFLNRI